MGSAANKVLARKPSVDAKVVASRNGNGNPLRRTKSQTKNGGVLSRNGSVHKLSRVGSKDPRIAAVSHALETTLHVDGGDCLRNGQGQGAAGCLTIGDDIIVRCGESGFDGNTLPRKGLDGCGSFSAANHYEQCKYSLFAGAQSDPPGQIEAQKEEVVLSPRSHVEVARESIKNGTLGILRAEKNLNSNGRSRKKHAEGENKLVPSMRSKSKKFDSETCVILLYADRLPIFIPKLDFSSLPNFRRPHMYNHPQGKGNHHQQQLTVNAKVQKVKGGAKGGKEKGVMGILGWKLF